MAKGKRMVDNHSNKSTHNRFKDEKKFNFKKFFIALLIIIILVAIVYLAYKYVPNFIANYKYNDNSDFVPVSSTNIEKNKTIKGLESMEITSIKIKTSDKDSSIIEINFKNISNSDVEESKAHFYALDSNKNIIFGMPLTIPEIKANSSTTYKVLCTSNLADAKDYEISIE